MKCSNCDARADITAVVDGKYGHYCTDCLDGRKRQNHIGSAQYSRDRDREDHEVDLLQPWDARGNPSKQFINHYPDEAHDIFTKEELEQHG